MKKSVLLTIALFSIVPLLWAENVESPLYQADWHYKGEALDADTVLQSKDPNAGKYSSNQEMYELGGWESVSAEGRPFYIGISQKKPIANTMEFVDNKQTGNGYTAYLISPELDFSSSHIKVISFLCGKEADNQKTSQIEVLYTTNYTGDASTTTWEILKEGFIPTTGFPPQENIHVTTLLSERGVRIAIRACKTGNAAETNAKQAKIRISGFNITERTIQAIPHTANWVYKAEALNDDGTVKTEIDPKPGTAQSDQTAYDLGGWESISTEDRPFFIAVSSSKPLSNTMEYRSSTASDQTSYMISPFINFSANSLKTISLKCGKEAANIKTQLELIYSTDYAGNPTSATWHTIKTNLIPAEQAGIGSSKLAEVTARIDLITPYAVVAIRVVKDKNTPEDGKKIRITNFKITQKSYSFNKKTGAITCGNSWNAELLSALDLSKATSLDITQITESLTGLTLDADKNPNCLIYANEALSNVSNVVVGDAAETIDLTDGYDFYNTKAFTASTIKYTRYLYAGWNTIAFPFPYTVSGEQIEEYGSTSETTVTFTEAPSTLTANQAYLIRVNADGSSVFEANDVTVPATASVGEVFKSNFNSFTMAADNHLYKLNADGTAFNHSDGGALIGAFRGYLDLSSLPLSGSDSAPRRIIHGDGGATNLNNIPAEGITVYTENGTLLIYADRAQRMQIYSIDGKIVRNIELEVGRNAISDLNKGIYLVKNRKVTLF